MNKLTKIVRIQQNNEEAVYYDTFLIRLRDGRCTLEDYNHIRMRCSNHSLSLAEWKKHAFCGENVSSHF